MSTLDSKKCFVEGKIQAIYETKVIKNAQSGKRKGQLFKVVPTEELRKEFKESLKPNSLTPTLKIDGTSCLIDTYNGRPWLWARHDVKPNKEGDKKFKEWKQSQQEQEISNNKDLASVLDVHVDFKNFPEDWKSATGEPKDSSIPSDNGHLVGWVPVDPSLRNHLWHLSVVNMSTSHALVAKHESNALVIKIYPLHELMGCTYELVGTNVNANPYGLGSKKAPLHFLIQHGEMPLPKSSTDFETYSHQELLDWFSSSSGQSEGIVWHSKITNKMFKVHRHHLQLPWPVDHPTLSSVPVTISLGDDELIDTVSGGKQCLFSSLKQFNNKTLECLKDIITL